MGMTTRMGWVRNVRVVLLAAVAATILNPASGPAGAAFPGRNGKLAFAGSRNIYVANPDGTGLRQITHDTEYRSTNPEWSPDGSLILFRCNGGLYAYAKKNEVCTMRPDGSDIRYITDNDMTEEDASWSPDGRQIVFIRNECMDSERCPLQIWVMDADGSDERQLTEESVESSFGPVFSPDGSRIAFDRECDVWVMDADGSDQVNLTQQYASGEDDPCEMAADWSPDGTKLAYMCLSDRSDYCGARTWNVWIISADGSRPQAVTGGKVGGMGPEWSPNGRRICFNGGPYSQIFTIAVDGTDRRRVTKGRHSRYSCSWRPR